MNRYDINWIEIIRRVINLSFVLPISFHLNILETERILQFWKKMAMSLQRKKLILSAGWFASSRLKKANFRLPRRDSWKNTIKKERERERERESESESESDPDTREASKGVAVYFQIVRPAKGINIGAKTAHPCHFPAPLPPTEKVTMSSRLYILLLVCLSLRRLERPKENADRVEKEAVECPTSFPARWSLNPFKPSTREKIRFWKHVGENRIEWILLRGESPFWNGATSFFFYYYY